MTDINWSEFKGDYVKWFDVDQEVTGRLLRVRVESYKDKRYPELLLQTADGTRIISASQANLMRQLAENPPAIGDMVSVQYLGEGEARPGQSAVKLFAVQVWSDKATTASSTPEPSDLV
jgi:hypothetical protein